MNLMNINIDKTKKEENKHGTALLPYNIYRTYIPEAFTDFPIHWHDEIEIISVSYGTAKYVVDFKEYIVREGDILIIPPSSLHYFEQHNDEHFLGLTYIFDKKLIDGGSFDTCSTKYINPIFNNDIYLPIHIPADTPHTDTLKPILDKILINHDSHRDAYELQIKIGFLEFISYFYSVNYYLVNKSYDTSNMRTTSLIKDVTTYIEEHYSDKITLEMLAEKINISVYYLSHIFKQYTNQTPIEYLNQYRLATAANLLKTTDSSIMDISFECGYNNVSYFNRAFKNRYNLTPKEYRKR